MFTKITDLSILILVIYVDDILISGLNPDDIADIKTHLHSLFTIKDMGEASYFLGLEIARTTQGILIAQTKYAKDISTDADLLDAIYVSSLLPHALDLSQQSTTFCNPEQYRRIIGKVLYLGLIRPDISYALQQLSQFMQSPCDIHFQAAIHLLKYIKGTLNYGLFYPSNSASTLTSYYDADWSICKITRKSLTGYCVFFGNSLVSWETKKQSTVSRSTTESKYESMGQAIYELHWIHYILQDLHVTVPLLIPLHCDNQAAIAIAKKSCIL